MSSAEHPIEISVVIPSWNTVELLRTCLQKLDAAAKPTIEIIIVDNGSEDGSADMVAESYPDVHLIRNERNEGFARGCNQGMRVAKGNYVLLLNTDTEIYAGALDQMWRFLEEHAEYGSVAPRLVHPDGSTQRTVQEFPTWRTALYWATPLERWFPRSKELRRYFMLDWDQESSRDIDQPPAACMLVRQAVLERVGLFDEDLWLFYNDVDLSKRMRADGWKTRYLGDALVVHHVGASTSKFGGLVAEYQRNRLRYYRKHHGRLAGLWVKACVTLAYLDYIAQILKKRLRKQPSEPIAHITRVYREVMKA